MIGIDLSQHSIKIAQFERGGTDVYKLTRLGIASLPFDESIPRDEQLRQQQTLLRNVKEACGIKDKSEHNILWYQKTFDYEKKQDVVLLHIEKSDYITKVWLNGQFVGEHKGGYDAFSFDVTKYIVNGANSIVVRVYDSKDARQPRGKQTWKATPFECFYHGTSGIYGDVWIEEVNESYLKSFVLVPSAKDRKLIVNANFSKKSIGAKFIINATFAGKNVAKHEYLINSVNQEFSLLIPGELKLWSAENPQLYDLELSITFNNDEKDKVLSYFGFNDVGIKGKYITLNHQEHI